MVKKKPNHRPGMPSPGAHRATGLGVHQEARDKFASEIPDPGRGKHLWAMFAMYQVHNPSDCMNPDGQILMDRENLLSIDGPGCFKCEKVWSPDVERRFCQGTPT